MVYRYNINTLLEDKKAVTQAKAGVSNIRPVGPGDFAKCENDRKDINCIPKKSILLHFLTINTKQTPNKH